MDSLITNSPNDDVLAPDVEARVAELHSALMNTVDEASRGRIHLELGRHCLKAGRLESAVRHLREALLLDTRLDAARSLLHELGEGSRLQEGRAGQRRSAVKALLGRLRR